MEITSQPLSTGTCSREETLKIMTERMPDRRPGDQQQTMDQPDSESSHMESIQTQYQQVGPCLDATPQRLPVTLPKYLGRGMSPRIEAQLPSPAPSLTSSDSSRPPSLESLTEPESGYEASISSSLDTE